MENYFFVFPLLPFPSYFLQIWRKKWIEWNQEAIHATFKSSHHSVLNSFSCSIQHINPCMIIFVKHRNEICKNYRSAVYWYIFNVLFIQDLCFKWSSHKKRGSQEEMLYFIWGLSAWCSKKKMFVLGTKMDSFQYLLHNSLSSLDMNAF